MFDPTKYKPKLEEMDKFKKASCLSIILFVVGVLSSSIGLFKGRDIASALSRPWNANVWSTPQESIAGWTYVPLLIGVSFIILSLIFSTILFLHWFKENN